MTKYAQFAEGTPCPASIDFDGALAILAAHVRPLGSELLPLSAAGGRRLAVSLCARVDSPRRDCAAMDGYAIRDNDMESGLVRLRAVGTSYAGDADAGEVGPGETRRVMTGAPLPRGADRVVMVEYCTLAGCDVTIEGAPRGKPHVRRKGSDFAAGELLLAAGASMTPATLIVAAAADHSNLEVARRPRILLLATGDELVGSGSASRHPYAIPDSLSNAIEYLCISNGAEIVSRHRLPDEAEAIVSACDRRSADIIIIVGGASRGDRDFGRVALAKSGLEIAFADVAIKPGKPVWYGRIGATHVLGLPGNPTAALTVARIFLVPLIAGLSGSTVLDALPWHLRPAVGPIPANGPREGFLCGRTAYEGVTPCERQEASSQVMLGTADCLIRRPANASAVLPGTLIPIIPLC